MDHSKSKSPSGVFFSQWMQVHHWAWNIFFSNLLEYDAYCTQYKPGSMPEDAVCQALTIPIVHNTEETIPYTPVEGCIIKLWCSFDFAWYNVECMPNI